MHPSFVRGFVKQCYQSGLTEDQAEAALQAWGLREQLEDPDFRAGFNKEANTLQRLTEAWNGLGRTGQGAVVGAGMGGLGGLLFGGKNRFRNSLLAALAGGGAGGLAGRYLGTSAASPTATATDPSSDLTMRVIKPPAGGFKTTDKNESQGLGPVGAGAVGALGGGTISAILPHLFKNPAARLALGVGNPLARVAKGALLGGVSGAAMVPNSIKPAISPVQNAGAQAVPTPTGDAGAQGVTIPSQPK
jgi:hypothetical protein